MTLSRPERSGRAKAAMFAGPLISMVVAVGLFTRFGINGTLGRDEAIYTYGGQQLAHGVAPYASIFDPKDPLATMIAGLGAAVARVVGHSDVYWIRGAFFACSCLAVLGVYLLAARLWSSVLAGVIAAVVFASFNGFAADALSGPDAKTPGVMVAVASMWLLARRQWFWAAFAGSLAFLVWQPLAIYPAVAVAVALVSAVEGERRRAVGLAVAGAAIPLVVVTAYFALAGALGKFLVAAFVFPATGVKRDKETLGTHFTRIVDIVHTYYGFSGVLFWLGFAALLALAAAHLLGHRGAIRQAMRDPLICVVLVTALVEIAYALYDFQGYPDVFPLLAYPALGLGGAAAVLVRLAKNSSVRLSATAGILAAATVLAAFSWSWFANSHQVGGGFRAQRADACAVERMLGPGGRLYALGDPTPLVIVHRRNPDRFIYLGSGVAEWKIKHTPGGFNGWVAAIRADNPSVITMSGWNSSEIKPEMKSRLIRAGYLTRYVGRWRVFLSPSAQAMAQLHHVRLTPLPTAFAVGLAGRELPGGGCG